MATRDDVRKKPGERGQLRRTGAGYSVIRPGDQSSLQTRSLTAEASEADDELQAQINEVALYINSDGAAKKIGATISGSFAPLSHTHPTSDVVSGTFADARVAESNITQHEAALVEPTAAKSANYTLTTSDHFIAADCTGGDVSIILPTAAGNTGRIYNVKRIDGSGNNVFIDGNGAETIDDVALHTLSVQYQSYTVISDGTEWWIL